jgi:KAP family P-loop domain
MSHADTPRSFIDRANDWLDRGPAVDALRRVLDSPALATPLVLGIYGGWGTGKTSVMQTLRDELRSPDRLIVWFDAWVYARQEQALWRALLLCVMEALRARTQTPDELKLQGAAYDRAKREFDALWLSPQELEKAKSELDEARASLYRSQSIKERGAIRVNWWGALPLAADAALTAVTAGLNKQIAKLIEGKDAEGAVTAALNWLKGDKTKEAIKLIEREASERYVEQVVSLEQFQAMFKTLLRRFQIGRGDENDPASEGKRRLYVFVDDLDRCLPEDAVAALEAIKLFLDLSGCVFVLGMDRAVVEQGIRVRYEKLEKAGFDARAYLDKIIQVPFNLPPLGEAQVTTYLARLSAEAGQGAFRAYADLIRKAAPSNPRALKRVLNALLVTLYLDGHDDASLQAFAAGQGDKDRARRLAKLVLLQVCFEPAWRAIADQLCSLKQAEKLALGEDIGLPDERKQELTQLFRTERLKALFEAQPRFSVLPDPDIAQLLTLSRVTAPTA